jgi:hypothetical protein
VTGVSGNLLGFGGGSFQPDTSALKGYTLQFTDALNSQTFQIFDNDKTTSTIQVVGTINGPVTGRHFTILEHSTRLIH